MKINMLSAAAQHRLFFPLCHPASGITDVRWLNSSEASANTLPRYQFNAPD